MDGVLDPFHLIMDSSWCCSLCDAWGSIIRPGCQRRGQTLNSKGSCGLELHLSVCGYVKYFESPKPIDIRIASGSHLLIIIYKGVTFHYLLRTDPRRQETLQKYKEVRYPSLDHRGRLRRAHLFQCLVIQSATI